MKGLIHCDYAKILYPSFFEARSTTKFLNFDSSMRFYFTGTEFLYDYNANLSKAVAAERLPLTILCSTTLKDSVGKEKSFTFGSVTTCRNTCYYL